MALTAAGFPGSVNDIQWSELLSLLGNDGTSGMNVTAAVGDRTVSIGGGVSNVGGILATVTGSETVGPLPTNSSGNTRIDLIVLRANWENRTLTVTFRAGTPSSNPQPPTIDHVRNPGVQYEVPLARVTVPTGQGPLNSGLITSVRTPPESGFYRISSIATAPDPSDNALIWYTAADSLRVPINGQYVEIAHGRPYVETRFGVDTNIDLTDNGVGFVQHDLGWVPEHMSFDVYLPQGDGQSIIVAPRFMTSPFTSTQAQIVAKSTISGAAVTSSLSRVGWTAYRTVTP